MLFMKIAQKLFVVKLIPCPEKNWRFRKFVERGIHSSLYQFCVLFTVKLYQLFGNAVSSLWFKLIARSGSYTRSTMFRRRSNSTIFDLRRRSLCNSWNWFLSRRIDRMFLSKFPTIDFLSRMGHIQRGLYRTGEIWTSDQSDGKKLFKMALKTVSGSLSQKPHPYYLSAWTCSWCHETR